MSHAASIPQRRLFLQSSPGRIPYCLYSGKGPPELIDVKHTEKVQPKRTIRPDTMFTATRYSAGSCPPFRRGSETHKDNGKSDNKSQRALQRFSCTASPPPAKYDVNGSRAKAGEMKVIMPSRKAITYCIRLHTPSEYRTTETDQTHVSHR